MDSDLTILIAEDNEHDVLLLERVLAKLRATHSIQIVGNGAEAIEYLLGIGKYHDRTRYPFPAIIVTDLKMPQTSGFELLQWLRNHAQFSSIPTIILSSSGDLHEVKRAYELGANAYLVKPNQLDDLETVLRSTLDFWSRCARPPLKS